MLCANAAVRLKTGAQCLLAEGSAVRNLARRALPMLGAGLALLTVAAAKPVLPEQPSHTGLAAAFARLHDQFLGINRPEFDVSGLRGHPGEERHDRHATDEPFHRNPPGLPRPLARCRSYTGCSRLTCSS